MLLDFFNHIKENQSVGKNSDLIKTLSDEAFNIHTSKSQKHLFVVLACHWLVLDGFDQLLRNSRPENSKSEKILGTPRIEPGPLGTKRERYPLCYAPPPAKEIFITIETYQ